MSPFLLLLYVVVGVCLAVWIIGLLRLSPRTEPARNIAYIVVAILALALLFGQYGGTHLFR